MPSRSRSCWLSIMHRAILLSVVVFVVGCDANSEQLAKAVPERVNIAVTSYPLLVMAEAMVGSAADIELVVSEDLTSPVWKPTADAIQAMQRYRFLGCDLLECLHDGGGVKRRPTS